MKHSIAQQPEKGKDGMKMGLVRFCFTYLKLSSMDGPGMVGQASTAHDARFFKL